MTPELKKQFQIMLFEKEVLITTPSNRQDAYEGKINYSEGKKMLLLDKNGMQHDWIETKEAEFNYYECCGVLILFGIEPPTFEQLSEKLLKINHEKSISSER